MKLLYQGNEMIDQKKIRREMLRQGAIEFLGCAVILTLCAALIFVMFLF